MTRNIVNVDLSPDDSWSWIDTTTLNAARAGDHQAWDAIVDRFADRVWSVVRRHDLTGSPADDVCRLTWMRLLDQLSTIQAELLGYWLVDTAKRESSRAVQLQSVTGGEGQLRNF
jgi:DNA-directed RNA polymerase specialized sigma24 family protein